MIKFLRFFFALTIFYANLSFAAVIQQIEIFGLDVISRGTVLNYLPLEVGDEFNETASNQALRALYQTQFFQDISITEDNQIVTIRVVENPHIKYIDIVGYTDRVLSEESMEKTLKSMKVGQGQIYNKRNLDRFVEQIKASYSAKGYYAAKVEQKTDLDVHNRIGIEIIIDEGDVAKIRSFKIIGAEKVDVEDLTDLFEIGEADFFLINYFTERDHFSQLAFDAGVEAMRSYYINLGYLDFEVVGTKTELSEDKESIDIEIEITEGDRYRIGEISFSGELGNEPLESLQALVTVQPDDFFQRSEIVKTVRAITDVFTNQGYALAKVDANVRDDSAGDIINLDININLGQKVYINRIEIEGNTRTRDSVIRREISVDEGGLFSDAVIKKSVTKIKRLGYFSSVDMEAFQVEGASDKMDLNIKVKEAKTGALSMGLAHSNNAGTSFNFGMKERNFLGTGNTLNFQLSQSSSTKVANFYFANPHFNEDGHSISYGVSLRSVDRTDTNLEDGTTTIVLTNSEGEPLKDEITGEPITLDCFSEETAQDGLEELGRKLNDPDERRCNEIIERGDSLTTDAASGNTISHTRDIQSVQIGYGIPLDEDTRINSELRLSFIDLRCAAPTLEPEICGAYRTDSKGEVKISEIRTQTDLLELKFNTRWIENTKNAFWFATGGAKNTIDLDLGLPPGDLYYYKIDAKHESFYDIGKDLTFKLNANFGLAKGYGGKDLPFFERYKGGGASSVRGFQSRSIGPKYANPKTGEPTSVNKGGEVSMLARASLVSPLKFLKNSANMRFGAFFDFGAIHGELSDFLKADDMRSSTGLGFSWVTPIGPIGVYVVRPLIKKSTDHTQNVEFILGTLPF